MNLLPPPVKNTQKKNKLYFSRVSTQAGECLAGRPFKEDGDFDDDEANVGGGGGGRGGGSSSSNLSVRYFPLTYVPIARGAFVMPSGGAAAGTSVVTNSSFGSGPMTHPPAPGSSGSGGPVGDAVSSSSWSLASLLPPKVGSLYTTLSHGAVNSVDLRLEKESWFGNSTLEPSAWLAFECFQDDKQKS